MTARRARWALGPAGLAALAALGSGGPAAGQARILTEVDTTLVTVGDRITLSVTVEHAGGTTVAWPDSLALAPFEVLDARASGPDAVGDRSVSALTLSLAAFELGELEIPSFEVQVLGPGADVQRLGTDRFSVEVVSVGRDETGDIRDIRGPLALPVGAVRVALYALALLAAALLGYLLHRRRRRPARSREEPARGVPARPAHELALEALARLEGSALLGRGMVKEFHIELADIVRTYVERRFAIDALEMTTAELLPALGRRGADHVAVDDLRRLLEQCDLVKFAKVRPGPEESLAALELGRVLVERTTPRVYEPAAAGGG